MKGESPAFGVLLLTLGAAREIVKRFPPTGKAPVVCRRITFPAALYLKLRLGDRLILRVLEVDPYYLPAQKICDNRQRNFRCDAIEGVIDVVRDLVTTSQPALDRACATASLAHATDIARRFLRHQAGEMLRNHVYLGYHLLSLAQRPDGIGRSVLLLPRRWWSDSVRRAFSATALRVVTHAAGENVFIQLQGLAQRLLRRAVPAPIAPMAEAPPLVRWRCEHEDPHARIGEHSGPRISGLVFDGLDACLRNNVGWAWCSTLPLQAFVFIWTAVSRLPNIWERDIGKHGANVVDVSPAGVGGHFDATRFRRNGRVARFVGHLLAVGYLFAVRPSFLLSARGRWQGTELALLISRSREWRRLFDQQRVRVHVEFDYGVDAYARALAIRRLGGVVILDQRSQYYDNYDHTSDRPGDLAFISGPSGLRYYAPSRFEVPQIIMTGLSVDGGNAVPEGFVVDTAARILRVAVFDEPGVLYGPEHVWAFIAAMIDHCHAHGGYQLVLKPKRWRNLVANLPPQTSRALDALQAAGRCVVLPAEISVHSVCCASDLIVSIPSTAACIAVGAGKPTVLYNPYHTIRTMFYEHGLEGQSIFDRLEGLCAAVSAFLSGDGERIGRCDRLRWALDPWLDMSGNQRKGFFLDSLIAEFAAGRERDDAMAAAMHVYRRRFGPLTAGSWQETWCGYGGEQSGLMLAPPRYDRTTPLGRVA